MPPKTESGSTSDTPKATPDHPNTALQDQLQVLIHLSTATNHHLDTITAHLGTQATNIAKQTYTMIKLVKLLPANNINGPPPPPPPPQTNHRPPKIHLPTFDGSNPLDWLFQAENYFTYYSVPPPQRLSLEQLYFTGNALSWYKYLANNQILATWPEFSQALELRFDPSDYENHQASLFKLKQVTNVAAYQAAFEKLCNRVTGLSNEVLLNCYLYGLTQDI